MDWITLFDTHQIPYVTRGPNTKRGEISIKCPWCGDDDPSEHMGISLTKKVWGCYRNAAHRGKHPARLIVAVLGCSFGQAKAVVAQYDRPDPSTFDDIMSTLKEMCVVDADQGVVQLEPEILTYPPEFVPIRKGKSFAKYWWYLYGRGFTNVASVALRYNLMCALTGEWKDRIIFPFFSDQKLIGWTGRAIGAPIGAPRYLSSSDAVKKTILDEKEVLYGGSYLFITEGPFDAMKIKVCSYNAAQPVIATCIFGTSLSIDQIALIRKASPYYKRVIILLDPDAVQPSFMADDWLWAKNVVIGSLLHVFPEDTPKDPGAMNEEQVKRLVSFYQVP